MTLPIARIECRRSTVRTRACRASDKLGRRKIADIDTEIGYVTASDAARAAITAHMLFIGDRVRAVARAHEAVGTYAEAMISTQSAFELQRMRR